MKKILITIIFLNITIFSFSSNQDVKEKIEKFEQYKELVKNNREKEIDKNLPSLKEIEIYYNQEKLKLEREKMEYEKKISYERAQAERRREYLIDTAIIGGIGYGTYRVGRHHHWW